MAKVKIRANVFVLGVPEGDEVTVERTELIEAHIASGHFTEVSESKDLPVTESESKAKPVAAASD